MPNIKDIVSSSVWALSAICRTKPNPNYMMIKDALPVFFYVIVNRLLDDLGIVSNVCWAISYYSTAKKEGPQKIDKIENVVVSGVVPHLLKLFDKGYDLLSIAILKILGNMANGTEKQCEYLIQQGVVPRLE